ncbi:RloB-like protein [Azospirillaceae bacterium]
MARLSPSLERHKPKREPKRRFFIFCEGKNTEPAYFEAIKCRFCGADIKLELIPSAGVPFTLAGKAAELAKQLNRGRQKRDSFEKNDQIWAVFDRDEHPNYTEAVQLCESNGVRVGRSNPCFELWLILHDQEFHRPVDRHAVQSHLQSIQPDYDPGKDKTLDCLLLMDRVEATEKRAEILLARRKQERDPFGPPSTTVGHLTREIRTAAASFCRP